MSKSYLPADPHGLRAFYTFIGAQQATLNPDEGDCPAVVPSGRCLLHSPSGNEPSASAVDFAPRQLSARQVVPLYALEKEGGFKPGDARGIAFAGARLAAGATALRNMSSTHGSTAQTPIG